MFYEETQTAEFKITSEQAGRLFAKLPATEQAEFLLAMARQVNTWRLREIQAAEIAEQLSCGDRSAVSNVLSMLTEALDNA